MPSEHLEFVKSTGTAHDVDNVGIPAAFVDFDAIENAPEPEKLFVTIKSLINICLECWGHSGICYRRQLNGLNSNPIPSSFPIHLMSTAFQLLVLFLSSEFWNKSIF